MKQSLFFTAIMLLAGGHAFSQVTAFHMHYDIPAGLAQVKSVRQTLDQGYIVGSYLANGNTTDWLVWKTDAAGTVNWANTIDINGYFDELSAVELCADSGFILCGTAADNSAYHEMTLVKIDKNGNLLWSKTYGNPGYNEWIQGIRETSDGGFVFVGPGYDWSGLITIVIKTDAQGNITWGRKYPVNLNKNAGSDILQTADGQYTVLTRRAYPNLGLDLVLMRLSGAGQLLWAKHYGGPDADYPNKLRMTSDGGYLLCGKTKSFGSGGDDTYIVKTDANGNLQWSKAFGGALYDEGFDAVQTADGGYAVFGTTFNYLPAGNSKGFAIKTDAGGNMLWSRLYGGTGYQEIFSGTKTSDGGLVMAGDDLTASPEQLCLIKTDGAGYSGCLQFDTAFTEVNPATLQDTTSGDSLYGLQAEVLVTVMPYALSAIPVCVSTGIMERPLFEMQVMPNPFREKFTVSLPAGTEIISVRITDVLGKEINGWDMQPKNQLLEFSLARKGVYFLRIDTGTNGLWFSKIISN